MLWDWRRLPKSSRFRSTRSMSGFSSWKKKPDIFYHYRPNSILLIHSFSLVRSIPFTLTSTSGTTGGIPQSLESE